MKQTAVEWLEQEFIKLESTIGIHGVMYELLDQAKEMEKQQIIDAVEWNYKSNMGEVYYKSTFNK